MATLHDPNAETGCTAKPLVTEPAEVQIGDAEASARFPVSFPNGPSIHVVKRPTAQGQFVASIYEGKKRIARARAQTAHGAVARAVVRYVNGEREE